MNHIPIPFYFHGKCALNTYYLFGDQCFMDMQNVYFSHRASSGLEPEAAQPHAGESVSVNMSHIEKLET